MLSSPIVRRDLESSSERVDIDRWPLSSESVEEFEEPDFPLGPETPEMPEVRDSNTNCVAVDTDMDGLSTNFVFSVPTNDVNNYERVTSSEALSLAVSDRKNVVIHSVDESAFRADQICVQTKGVGGLFWTFEEPAPPPKIITVGSSIFISGVGGALHHDIVRILPSVSFSKSLCDVISFF